MKKWIALMLALVMVLGLAACGQSESAKNAETLMLAANENDKDSIKNAIEAYNALEEKEREQVSTEAKESLYKARLYMLANELIRIDSVCERVAKTFVAAWESAGTDRIMKCVEAASMFAQQGYSVADYVEEISKARGKEYTEENILTVLWGAAIGFNPDALEWVNGIASTKWVSDVKKQETLDICAEYNANVDYLKTNMVIVAEEIREFRNEYKNQYPDEVATLNDWCIETNLFCDFVLYPSGSQVSYNSELNEFANSMNRFKRTMDAYY